MFDCHYHLDESIVSIAGLLSSMDAAGVSRSALIGPFCPTLELSPTAALAAPFFRWAIHRGPDRVRRAARAMYRSWVRSDGTASVGFKRYPVDPQPNNDKILNAVALHPGRFVGWIAVNPAGPADPLAEIDRCAKTPGMIGVKAHPFWHDYAVSRLEAAAALCTRKGLAMLLHLGTGRNGDWRFLPERLPALKVIYAHAGIPYSPEICDYAREKKNVHIDLSSTSYVDRRCAREAVRRAGARKCLFGTDGPYFHSAGDRFDFGVSLAVLRGLGLSPADRERVEKRNFEEIIGK